MSKEISFKIGNFKYGSNRLTNMFWAWHKTYYIETTLVLFPGCSLRVIEVDLHKWKKQTCGPERGTTAAGSKFCVFVETYLGGIHSLFPTV